jgi:hypothetical protein
VVNTFFFGGSGGVPPREPFETPEREKEYPEPSMFGLIPAHGFFIRHAKGIDLTDIHVSTLKPDGRPALVLDNVKEILLDRVVSENAGNVSTLVLKNAEKVTIQGSRHLPDGTVERADRKDMGEANAIYTTRAGRYAGCARSVCSRLAQRVDR